MASKNIYLALFKTSLRCIVMFESLFFTYKQQRNIKRYVSVPLLEKHTARWLVDTQNEKVDAYEGWIINPLSASPTKWSNPLKQFVGKLPTNCLSVFDHFVELALKVLTVFQICDRQNQLLFSLYVYRQAGKSKDNVHSKHIEKYKTKIKIYWH